MRRVVIALSILVSGCRCGFALNALLDHAPARDLNSAISPRTMVYLKVMLLPFCRIGGVSCGSPLETVSIAMTVTPSLFIRTTRTTPAA